MPLTAEPIAIVLDVGEGGQCPYIDDLSNPLAFYEPRAGETNLRGTVVALSGTPLPNASINLMKANLDAPAGEAGLTRDPAMKHRVFHYSPVAQKIASDSGEFQFTALEPGWYSLRTTREGYYDQVLEFWVARETLTTTTRIHMVPRGTGGCGLIFGPARSEVRLVGPAESTQ